MKTDERGRAPGSRPSVVGTRRGAYIRNAAVRAMVAGLLFQTANYTAAQVKNPPPLSLSITNIGAGSYAIGGSGVPGQSYSIQSAGDTSRTNWQMLGVVTAGVNGLFVLTDSNHSYQRFYRSVYSWPTNAGTGFSPMSIPGLAHYWTFQDLPISSAVNSWTDRVAGAVLQATASPPTNTPLGVEFTSDSFQILTNSGIMMGSNFSLWYVFREHFPNNRSVLFGSYLSWGLSLSNGVIDGYWASDNTVGTVLPLNQSIDLVDAQGVIYTNGASAGGSIGQPTNNYPFQSVGNVDGTYPLYGYVSYIGIWTNYALTPADVSKLDTWVNTNGVTNVTAGLIEWWKLDEGTGTLTADSSGNGHNGQLVSGAVWTAGKIGGAITNNGSSYIDITNSGSVADNLADFSVSFWFITTDTSDGQRLIVGKMGNGGFNNGWGWCVMSEGSASDIRGYYQGDAATDWVETQGISGNDGNWHHYVICKDSTGNMMEYEDGAFDTGPTEGTGIGSVNSFSNTNNIRFGSDYDSDFCPGSLDDVRIYNRVLSPQEVAILYRWRGQQ